MPRFIVLVVRFVKKIHVTLGVPFFFRIFAVCNTKNERR